MNKLSNKKKKIIEVTWLLIYPAILYLIFTYVKSGEWIKVWYNMIYFIERGAIHYILLPYILFLALGLVTRGLFKKSYIANIVGTTFLTIISIVSYYKYLQLGAPLVPQDVTLIGNAGEIAQFGISSVPLHLIISLIMLVMVLIFNFKMEKKLEMPKLHKITRLILIVVGATIVFLMSIPTNRYSMMKIRNVDGDNYNWIGPHIVFFVHLGDFVIDEPKNYSKESIENIKAKYEVIAEQTEKIKPNVIFIMNESYSNPNKLANVKFSKNPMGGLDKIKAVQGEILSPVYGGGTSFPEFEALTGLTTYFLNLQTYPYTSYIMSDMNSNIRIFKENGYYSTGIHPYAANFYSRNKVYDYFGFDKTIFIDDLEEPEYRGDYVSDNEVAEQILKQLNSKNENQIIFSVTMQNHMKYTKRVYENYDIEIESDVLTDDEIKELKNYAQGVYDSTQMYIKLANALKNTNKPTLLVMFGDHLPILGTSQSTYSKNGFGPGSKDFFKTPYIIWSNYNAEINVPKLINPSNLGLKVLQLANLDLPWYVQPFIKLHEENPALSQRFSKIEENELIKECELIQYDLLFKKKYIDILGK